MADLGKGGFYGMLQAPFHTRQPDLFQVLQPLIEALQVNVPSISHMKGIMCYICLQPPKIVPYSGSAANLDD